MENSEFLSKISKLSSKVNSNKFPVPVHVTSASRDDLEEAFKVESVRRSLFPSGVLVRDSQSFGVEERFARFNIPLILADRLAAMFATRHDVTNALTSLSFGTALESSVTRHILRYVIDYYGQADIDVIKSHVLQHLVLLPHSVRNSDTAKVVCFHVFVPKHIDDVIRFDDLHEFIGALGFARCGLHSIQQCYGVYFQLNSKV